MAAALLSAGTVPPSTAGQLAGSRQAAVAVPAPRPAGELTVGAGEDTTFRATSAATSALDQVRPEYADVVVWLSQHLAALDRVVYAASARQLPQARHAIRAQRASGRDLERVLRRLHAHLNGDGSAPLRELTLLHRQLQQTLRKYSEGERRLLERLSRALPAQDWDRLTARYRASWRTGRLARTRSPRRPAWPAAWPPAPPPRSTGYWTFWSPARSTPSDRSRSPARQRQDRRPADAARPRTAAGRPRTRGRRAA